MGGLNQAIIGTAELALPESIARATMGAPPVDTQGFEIVLAAAIATTQIVGTIPPQARAPAYVSILNTGTDTFFVSFGRAPTDVLVAANVGIQLAAGEGLVLDNPRKGTILAINPTGVAGELRAQGAWSI